MQIDSGTAIVTLVIILICLIPVLLFRYYRSKKEKNMLTEVNKIAQSINSTINHYEFKGLTLLAIDTKTKCLFYCMEKNKQLITNWVDLTKVQSCQLVKKQNERNNTSSAMYSIHRIELKFSPKDKSQEEKRFELYDQLVNMQLTGELQFAEKWAGIIQQELKHVD